MFYGGTVRVSIATTVAGWLCVCYGVAAQIAIPPLKARVTDLAGILTAQQTAALEGKLLALERRKGSQLAVLIVPSTDPEDIAQFGIRVADQWKLGRKGVDDGAILIVAKDDRRLRIEIGYGLEGVLTDALSKRIIEQVILPHFKQGDYYRGIDGAVDWIIRAVDGEPLPAPDDSPSAPPRIGLGLFLLLLFLFFGMPLFASLFGGAHVWSNRNYGRRGRDYWGGGWGGGFGGRGGFGGGGFGGGGGSFGGGGASGSW